MALFLAGFPKSGQTGAIFTGYIIYVSNQ